MKILTTLLVIVQFLFLCPLEAREQTDLSLEITSSLQGGEAKQDAFDQATEQAAKKLTEDLIGPEKVTSQWATIGPKLLKNSTRFVIFIKGSQPVPIQGGSKVTVTMRLAPDAVEGLLREMGVFAADSVHLLPLVRFSESGGTKYIWWADGGGAGSGRASNQADSYFRKVSGHLNAQFKAKSAFVLDPTVSSFRMGVPAAYRSETLRREDEALLAQYLKADVILTGKVDVVRVRPDGPEHRIDYELQLWQAKSGRPIAELTRSENVPSDNPKVVGAVMDQVDKKVFGELAAKLADAVGSGSLNLNVMRVSVVGNLNFRQQADFRKQLGGLREVRALKERLFEPQRVVYEVETPSTSMDLARAVQKASFKNFSVSIDGTQDDSLVLGVRATSAQ